MTDTNCRDDVGIAVGLVDGLIAIARTLRRLPTAVLQAEPMREALADLRDDEDIAALLAALSGSNLGDRR